MGAEWLLLKEWTSVAAVILAFSVPTAAMDLDVPGFQQGLWFFKRTMQQLRDSNATDLQTQEMIRCVDPTIAMRLTFRSPDVGNCRSATPELVGNRYVFSNRCDYMGPVRTEITVESATAYQEVNELVVGAAPRRETIVARRLGDCRK